ncbi:oxygenase MpaB family protein [Mycobacterium sp. PDNC021]|uniref:oxygenase MpaB family protein n=1 Tax=Mycobacterium sp. PDNC021 TaxID=3391399 RepID=UPI003AABC8AB
MTDVVDVGGAEVQRVPDPDDLVIEDIRIGKNVYFAGSVIKERSGDDSLRPKQRNQRPVPANSLLCKYMGDAALSFSTGQRLAIVENMWPQLGQGSSDHSLIFNSGGFGALQQRVRNSFKTINGVLYAPPDEAMKFGVQVRNFHKSVQGDMPNGRAYHAINAETFYWAHATFFENLYRANELGVFDQPLTRAECEQIFEESKDWFSMYGVDDRAQPQTFAEFEVYRASVLKEHLVNTKAAQFTVGLAKPNANFDRFIPPRFLPLARAAKPVLVPFLRIFTAGALEPYLRERLQIDWSEQDERGYRRFIATIRLYRRWSRRLHLPLSFRYGKVAVAAFEREGVNPDDITLESAREALRLSRLHRDESLVSAGQPVAVTMAPADAVCVRCERPLEDCKECAATGLVDAAPCDVCHGARRGCRVHHDQWDVLA